MTNSTLEQRLTKRLKDFIESHRKDIAKFRDNLDRNPRYAFEWADSAIYAAAAIDVYTRAVLHMEAGATAADVLDAARREVIRMAGYMEGSTSTSSNHVQRAVLASTVTLTEQAERIQ